MSDDPLRVLHIMGSLNPSGMERMLQSAEPHFRGLGVEGYVLAQGSNNPYAVVLSDAGYSVHVAPTGITSRRGAKLVRELIVQNRIDVVHVHTEGDYLRTVLVARTAARGVRVVRTVHNVFRATGRWRFSRWAQALIADRLLVALIAPSPDVAANEKTIGRRARVILNWVDERYLTKSVRVPPLGEPPVAIIVGNCSTVKRHELALAAIDAAGHSVIHLGLEDHASEAELELLNKLEAAGRLKFRGSASPDAHFDAADYFAMSSVNEGMPVSLAEAIAAGLPAFVTDVPGMQWAREFPEVEFLAPVTSDWIAALRRVSYRAQSMTAESHIDFSPARGAREYVEVYRN